MEGGRSRSGRSARSVRSPRSPGVRTRSAALHVRHVRLERSPRSPRSGRSTAFPARGARGTRFRHRTTGGGVATGLSATGSARSARAASGATASGIAMFALVSSPTHLAAGAAGKAMGKRLPCSRRAAVRLVGIRAGSGPSSSSPQGSTPPSVSSSGKATRFNGSYFDPTPFIDDALFDDDISAAGCLPRQPLELRRHGMRRLRAAPSICDSACDLSSAGSTRLRGQRPKREPEEARSGWRSATGGSTHGSPRATSVRRPAPAETQERPRGSRILRPIARTGFVRVARPAVRLGRQAPAAEYLASDSPGSTGKSLSLFIVGDLRPARRRSTSGSASFRGE